MGQYGFKKLSTVYLQVINRLKLMKKVINSLSTGYQHTRFSLINALKLSTVYLQVINSPFFQLKLSTSYQQVINKLSTGYQQPAMLPIWHIFDQVSCIESNCACSGHYELEWGRVWGQGMWGMLGIV
jgi:hypothetical protein